MGVNYSIINLDPALTNWCGVIYAERSPRRKISLRR